MTIKEIKETWSRKQNYCGLSGKKMFTTVKFSEPIGKCVIMVVKDPWMDRYVEAIIRVSTGEDILNGMSRPCDNMEDAVEVACEMVADPWSDLNIPDEWKKEYDNHPW